MRRDVAWVVIALLSGGMAGADPLDGPEDPPDIGFLEYLGGLVEEDDVWIGPDDMTVAPDSGREEVVSDSAGQLDPETEVLP